MESVRLVHLLTELHIWLLIFSCVTVSACPATIQCQCVEKILFCVGANFTEIPYDIPHDVRHLDFHSGVLETVEADKLSLLKDLHELTMDKNRIIEIENGTFDNLVRLQKISLNENQIRYLLPGLFSNLKKLKFLFLAGNMLENVEGLFGGLKELESLNLDNNQVKYLSDDTFKGLTKLYDLHINNNQIVSVHPDTFTQLTALVVLGLGSNPIKNLDDMLDQNTHLHFINLTDCNFNTFPGKLSSSLQYLKLRKNSITNIYRNETARYSNLVKLFMEQNNLEYVEEDSFISMPNLTDIFLFVNNLTQVPGRFPPNIHNIYLDSNAITSIQDDTFQPQTDIRLLSLSSNNIDTFDSSSLRALKSVQELKLDENPLRILHDNIFLQVPGLEVLTLNRLNIHEIYPNCFLGLDNLHTLSMSQVTVQSESNILGNFLIHVPTLEVLNLRESPLLAKYFLTHVTVMESVANLTTLNLENNGLASIPSILPWHLPSLTKLYLAGNPFHCSEDIFWLHEWYMMESYIFRDMDKVSCHSPADLKGKLLRDILLEDVMPGITNGSQDATINTTDFTSTTVISYDDATYYYDYLDESNEDDINNYYDNYDFLSFSTVTVTKFTDGSTTTTQTVGQTSTPENITKELPAGNKSKASTDFRSIVLAIGMAFAVILVMLLISGIVYCACFRRRHNVVHHNARQNNGTNDYVFIVSKTDIQNENGAKPAQRLTREERGSTTSHASQDITNDGALKVYTLDMDQ